MADDPLKEAAKVIPSVYYDLIARVASGGAVLAAGLGTSGPTFAQATLEHIALLTLGAYIVGMVLTPFGAAVGFGIRKIMLRPPCSQMLTSWGVEILKYDEWKRGPNDKIAAANPEAGATIAKMQAEAALCHNMFVGILAMPLVWLAINISLFSVKLIAYWLAAVILLAVAALYRTGVYLGRQKQLCDTFQIAFDNEGRASGSAD